MENNNNNLLPTIDNEGKPTIANEQPVEQVPQDLTGVVEELKALRKKNREIEEELTTLKTRPTETTPEPKEEISEVSKEVEAQLKKREEEQALKTRQLNLRSAAEKFKLSHKEVNPENDKDGTFFNMIEDELKGYNLSMLNSEEDFLKVLKKAGITSGVIKTVEEPASVPIPTSMPTPKGGAGYGGAGGDAGKLSNEELKVIEANPSWTADRLLKLRETMPAKTYAEMIMAYTA